MPKLNLMKGQYQLGDEGVIFGSGTMLRVQNVQVQSYQTVPQDHSSIRSDTILMGQDSLTPSPIVFEIFALENRQLDNVVAHTGGQFDDEPYRYLVDQLAADWRGDSVRSQWNGQIPLRVCDKYGRTRIWMGRPRKFEAGLRTIRSTHVPVNAEFMPSDTLAYSDDEYGVTISAGQSRAVTRLDGLSTTGLRFSLRGPAANPTINFGSIQLKLSHTLATSEIVEISSYSWQMRVVNSQGVNLAAKLTGNSRYLDRVRWPAKDGRTLSFSASGTSGNTRLTLAWREAWPLLA